MGTGFYSPDSKSLHLRVVFSFAATAADLQEWRGVFEFASVALDHAIGVRIGVVEYVIDSSGNVSNEVDLVVLDELGTGHSGTIGGLGNDGSDDPGGSGYHMGVKNLAKSFPGLLVHELGHYMLGLGDEYPVTSDVHCIDESDLHAAGTCIMQRSSNSIEITGPATARWFTAADTRVTEFCHDVNINVAHRHGADGGVTMQQSLNGGSCWSTIQSRFSDLGPPSATPALPSPGSAVTDVALTTMVQLASEKRFVLVLDRSGSMASAGAIEGVRHGAHTWIDMERLLENELGLITYSTAPSGDVSPPVDVTPGNVDTFHDVVDGLAPGGLTNISDALAWAQADLVGSGNAHIVLFSDGVHNVGMPPPAPGPGGPVVHTIGFGNVNETQLMQITSPTGTYRRVVSTSDVELNELRVNNAISEVASDVHSSELGRQELALELGSPDQFPDRPGSPPDLELVASLSPEDVERLAGIADLVVDVEEGITQVTFVANHRSADAMFLYVLDPTGAPVEPDRGVFAAGDAHATYSLTPHAVGRWTMRLRRLRGEREDPAPAVMFAFAERPLLTVGLAGAGSVYKPGERVVLRAVAQYPAVLTDLSIRLWPDDKPSDVREFVERVPGNFEIELPPVERPGSYDFVVEYVGTDATVEVVPLSYDPDIDGLRRRPGPFRRIRRVQVHYGPLSEGEDTDPRRGTTVPVPDWRRWWVVVRRVGVDAWSRFRRP